MSDFFYAVIHILFYLSFYISPNPPYSTLFFSQEPLHAFYKQSLSFGHPSTLRGEGPGVRSFRSQTIHGVGQRRFNCLEADSQ